MELNLKYIKQNMLLVRPEVRGISLFRTSANFGDFGLSPTVAKEVYSRHTAGVRQMVDPTLVKKLRSLETSLRSTVNHWGYEVPGFLPYRLATHEAMDRIEKAYAEYAEKWNAVVREIVARHGELRNEWAVYMGSVAVSAYAKNPVEGMTQEEYMRSVQMQALARFPSVDAIVEGVTINLIVAPVRTSLDYEQELLELQKVRAERELADQQFRLAVDNNVAEANAQRDRMIELARQRIQEEIQEPLEGLVSQLKARIADSLRKVESTLLASNNVHHSVVASAKSLADWAVVMGIESDTKLLKQLEQIGTDLENQRGIEGGARKDTMDDIRALISDIEVEISGATQNIARYGRADDIMLSIEED